jgi:predicted dehydrogenase/threonine dehydrogenase-like Zn-dependent dehydrogenase
MKQVLQNNKTGALKVVEVPSPILPPGGLLVRTEYSLISKGTERMKVDFARKSMLSKAKGRPDLVRQVLKNVKKEGWLTTFRKVMARLQSSAPLGYSSAGQILAVGELVEGLQVGDKVACAGAGYANHAGIAAVPKNLCARIPEGVSTRQACFTTLGAIALQGIRQAEVKLGESVALIGLGILGQLCVQMLKASGCQVIGTDIDESMTRLARDSGADLTLTIRREDLKTRVQNFTAGHGVDAVIITAATESNQPLELSGEICRDRGKVVIVGAVKADLPRKNFYEKELDVRFSRSCGPGRYDHQYEEMGVDYPYGYVRWTENRNMDEFLSLLKQGQVSVEKLITHQFAIEDGEKAYDVIMNDQKKSLAVLLNYESPQEQSQRIWIREAASGQQSSMPEISIGFIGAGNFARVNLLPHLTKKPEINLRGVVTSTGSSALDVAKKFGFGYCASRVEEILEDDMINCVFVATRHDRHAELACRALEAGKAVFVEKPLAMNEDQLKDVAETMNRTNARLMVGFNRRFSSGARMLKEHFGMRSTPLSMSYRVNAGAIPADHWVHDPVQGGGRIIGEVCHFVDLLSYLAGSRPKSVFARGMDERRKTPLACDNLNVIIEYEDGSVGSIIYTSAGDASYPKERVEVFGEGSVGVMDDFQRTTLVKDGKRLGFRQGGSGKGHKEEVEAFLEALGLNQPMPISREELICTTLSTFRIVESLQTGLPMEVPLPERAREISLEVEAISIPQQ